MGTFPVRFPSPLDPGDAGWHNDGSFGDPPSYKVNFASRGRALLLLMLYTDVGPKDAPTRIRVGSHLDVARALARIEGDVTFVPERHAPSVLDLPIRHAVGSAGTVYLCHPFLVHAATWPHEGLTPRLVAQPCIHHPEGEWLGGFDYDTDGDEPVVRAVRLAVDPTVDER
ncbi:MAG: phytanoyl-CoA dioxygenase family protein [Acidimicrobiales bacterium]